MQGQLSQTNSIFQQPWWLDAVAPNQWAAAEVRQGEEVRARLPYVVRNGPLGLKMLRMPQLTQTLGPWLAPSTAKHAKRLAQQKDLLTSLIEQLPACDYFSQRFHYSITNWLPFYWEGFNQTTHYTYIIRDLTDLEKIYSAFSHNKRKNIKKSEGVLEVRQDLTCKDFYDHHVLTLEKQKRKIAYSYELFSRIYNSCYKNNAAKIFYSIDTKNNIHSAIFTIWDKNSAYDLISTIDPDFRVSGSASLLIWEALKFYSDKTKSFDFEGSMIEGVERSFRAFGAEQIPYFRITRMSRRMRLVMAGWEAARALFGH